MTRNDYREDERSDTHSVMSEEDLHDLVKKSGSVQSAQDLSAVLDADVVLTNEGIQIKGESTGELANGLKLVDGGRTVTGGGSATPCTSATNLNMVSSFTETNPSAAEMDEKRKNTATRAFLVKMAEAREWINRFVPVKNIPQLLEELPKGVMLATIASKCGFKCDIHVDKAKYYEVDNIYAFLRFAKSLGLSSSFLFETTDLREMRHLRPVMYTIHAVAFLVEKRGIAPGINKNIKLTAEELAMVQGEENEDDLLFDNLEGNLVKAGLLEESACSESATKIPIVEEIGDISGNMIVGDKIVSEDDRNTIANAVNTYLWKDAFNNILYKQRINLMSIRKFIHLVPQPTEVLENTAILARFRANYEIKEKIDGIYKNSRLLLENQAKLRGISFNSHVDFSNSHAALKKLLYLFLTNYDVVRTIYLENDQLPLERIYSDSIIGDYHYTKLLMSIKFTEYENGKVAETMALRHFLNSKLHQKLERALGSRKLPTIDPVEIYREIYDLTIHDQQALVETAIGEERVQRKLIENAQAVIEWLNQMKTYLEQIEFPEYCNVFEDKFIFIEQALLAGENAKYVSILHRAITGRMTSYNTPTTTETQNPHLTFVDFLDSCEFSPLFNFMSDFSIEIDRTVIDKDELNERMLSKLEYSDGMYVTVTYGVVNALLLILKKHRTTLTSTMYDLLSQIKLEDISANKSLGSTKSHSTNEMVIRFDHVFTDNDDFSSTYSAHIIQTLDTVKRKLCFMIKHTSKRDMMSMLYIRDKVTEHMGASSDFGGFDEEARESLRALRESIFEDLDFLEKEGITYKRTSYQEMLEFLAMDILRPDSRDTQLEGETADIVYQRGEELSKQYTKLEKYYNTLTSIIFIVHNRDISEDSNNSALVFALGDVVNDFGNSLLSDRNLKMSITQHENDAGLFVIELIAQEAIVCRDELYLTDLLREQENETNEIEIGRTVNVDVKKMIHKLNKRYVRI